MAWFLWDQFVMDLQACKSIPHTSYFQLGNYLEITKQGCQQSRQPGLPDINSTQVKYKYMRTTFLDGCYLLQPL